MPEYSLSAPPKYRPGDRVTVRLACLAEPEPDAMPTTITASHCLRFVGGGCAWYYEVIRDDGALTVAMEDRLHPVTE